MLKARELRIGNLVYFMHTTTPEVIQITPRFFSSLAGGQTFDEQKKSGESELPEQWQPIGLTEDWLIKFGFEMGAHGFDRIKGDFIVTLEYEFYYKNLRLQEIQYIHQLQNIFFALSGEELILIKK